MAVRRLALAGRVGFEVDGVATPSGGLGRPGRLALAYLACERHRPVPRDELADVVWGEELPASWEQMLRGLALKIRGALAAAGVDEAALSTAGGTFRLALPPDVVVDVEEAAVALGSARAALAAGDAPGAQEAAARAAAVAGRQFAPGSAGTWVERRQAELRELHLGALEALAQAALAEARWPAAVVAAEEAVAAEPFRESAYSLLMAAHAGAGNRGEALRAYQRCRAVLAEELGVSPSAPTEAAYLRLLGDETAPAAIATPPLALPPALDPAPASFVVGREAEAAALAAAFKRATVEGRRAVLVGGEAGVGKTTLVAHAARAAHAEGARVLYGRCDEDLEVAYQPFAQALDHYVLGAPLGELADHVAAHGGEAARLVPALARRLPGTPLPMPADPDTARWRLFEAVVGLLTTAATAAPVVVVLDDLHWAAPATLALLRHVLASTSHEHVLILGTYRASEVGPDHPLSAALADLRRLPGIERLALAGLDRAGVEAFVAASREAAGDDLGALAEALWAHTAGNAFFVGELLRHLDQTGAVLRRHGSWRYYAGEEALDVPEGVLEVVGRRMARLSAETNRVLTLASVVGAEFDLDVVEEALGPADADLALDAVEEAAAAQLVVEVGPAGYRFAHALVRDALYRRLGAARRARLHRRVGEAIKGLPADEGVRLPALAHHFAEAAAAGCADEAADYALAAADQVLAIAADAAVAILQRGLAALDTAGVPDRRRRVSLLVALSLAHYRDGQNDEGREVAQAAAREAQAQGMVDELAEAACLQSFGVGGQGQQAELVEAAIEAVGDGSPALRARLLGALAVVRVPFDEVSDRLSEQAVELARASGDGQALYDSLSRRWTVLLGTPHATELLAVAEERLAVGEPWLSSSRGYDERLISRLINGDRPGFDADVETLDRLGRENRGWGARSNSARWRVVQALLDGRFEQVEELAARTDDIFAEKRKRPGVRHRRPALLWSLGRFDELLEVCERGLAAADVDGRQFSRGWLAVARAGVGDTQAARADLADLTEQLPRLRRVERSLMAANLVEVAAALEDAEPSARLYEWLLPFAGQVVAGMMAFCLGSVDRHLGMLATVVGRWDQAEAHFEAALKLDTALSSPPLLARTQYWYASLLLRRPERDCARAAELLAAAGSSARRLGMAALAAQVNALQ